MNLLCPSCQKMLQVPEQYAGQQMRCPLCNNLFTVPGLPETPALAPPPPPVPPPAQPEPAAYSFANEPPPPPALPPLTFEAEKPSATSAPAPAPQPTPPLLVGDYTKLRSITISPRVVPWIAPIALFVLFLLTFFPWFGGGEGYSAWSLAFGYGSDFAPPGGVLFIFYDLLIIFAVLAGLGSLLMYAGVIPPSPQLRGIEAWRGIIVGCLTWPTFLLLFFSVLINLFRLNVVYLNFWGWLAYDCHFIAAFALLLQTWLERRGPAKPPPRIDLHT